MKSIHPLQLFKLRLLLFILLCGLLNSMKGNCQLPTYSKTEQANLDRWYDIYEENEYTALDYIELIDKINFKFVKDPTFINEDMKTFKAVLLQLESDALRQMNLDANYYCSLKHDEFYLLWNMYYPKITKEFWDMNCKGLFILMKLDRVVVVE